MSSLKNIQDTMIEKYATIFKDIDASIIKDIILTTNDHTEIEEYLNEINNGVNKSKGEIQNELENNYGTETISELKFEHNGTSHNSSINKNKSSYLKFKNLGKVFKFNSCGESKGFQKI
mgnify:FL=1